MLASLLLRCPRAAWWMPRTCSALASQARLLCIDPGFYLEFGAMNGDQWSNTKWLHDNAGWKGLLIEADPGGVERARKSGSASLSPLLERDV